MKRYPDGERKPKGEYGYRQGILTGILLTVLLFAVGVCGKEIWKLSRERTVSWQTAAVEQAQSEQMGDKVELLLQEIDENFLFEYDEQEMADAVYHTMLDALEDPYSEYYTAEEYSTIREKMSGSFYGIGVVMRLSEDETHVEVVSLVDGSSAQEVGILPGDWLCQADGTSLKEMSLSEIVALVRGKEGTTVHMQVYRPSEDAYYEYDVERRKIETDSVYSEMLEDSVGYIQITEFDSVTDEQFQTALESLMDQGMEHLVIDLRNNLGGTVDSVVNIANMLLPEELITYTETKDGTRKEYHSDANQLYQGSLAVLINGNSASASEILAGAVQDSGRGTLIGTTSFGKGIVQSVRMLSDGTAVKLTVARYYTPNGTCIHEIGIEPDVTVELSEEAIEDGLLEREEDNQLEAAIQAVLEKSDQS